MLLCGRNIDTGNTNVVYNLSGYNFSQCPLSGNAPVFFTNSSEEGRVLAVSLAFFVILLPVVICVGLCGNIVSLVVFLSTGMRKQHASVYLVAISMSDITVLLAHVLIEWIQNGLVDAIDSPSLEALKNLLADDGICKIRTYISGAARFLSAWLVVVFTCERYIGVCHPFKKLEICTVSWSRKVVLSFLLISLTVSIYNPILNVKEKFGTLTQCTCRRSFEKTCRYLNGTYGFIITVLPCVVIFVLNSLMAYKLCRRNRTQKQSFQMSADASIKMEFTFILLALSTTFLVLNLPYFLVWAVAFIGKISSLKEALYITKAFYFINYCINFFLYSMTGAYFRRELRVVCGQKKPNDGKGFHRRMTTTNSNSSNLTGATQTQTSWV